MSTFNSYRIIYCTFFISLIGAIFPLPLFLNAFRPDWMMLVIFYWVLALPHRVSIFHAFILGVLLDSVIRLNIRHACFSLFYFGLYCEY
ncbi:rod shape-determining protein MreD [Psychromonas sp. MME2]|uniref:rod shape-determining protein MreD n=1 Tax=Psychromonas sp. MME2 TaxID=3231033 RepID=UPI00339C1605